VWLVRAPRAGLPSLSALGREDGHDCRKMETEMHKLVFFIIFSLMTSNAVFAASGDNSPNAGDVSAGHALALRLCTPCHVVSPDQEMPPILREPAPSFRTIANKRDTTSEET